MSHTFKVGEMVRLNVPENIRLHGAEAKIMKLTEWGAHVWTLASGRNRFRALFSEMIRDGSEMLALAPGEDVTKDTMFAPPTAMAQTLGYTGEFCNQCGGARVTRCGTCMKCEDCGAQSGCS